jgi:CTP:molybdopterin cytidylyltransferase MocA
VTYDKVDAVILAGGDGEVIDPTQRFKGLVEIAGRPLVEWVVDAFRAAHRVGEIAVVIPTAENLGGWVDRVDKLVVSNRDFMDNAIAGAAAFREDRPVVIATGDIPLRRLHRGRSGHRRPVRLPNRAAVGRRSRLPRRAADVLQAQERALHRRQRDDRRPEASAGVA